MELKKKTEGPLSAQFRAWLLKRMSGLQKGIQLPTGKELALEWNISVGTVRNVLRSLAKEGKLVLIAGKGTFVPKETDLNPELQATANHESEFAVINFLLKAIREGELRIGQAFPARKFFQHKFKLAPATVSNAYRKLEDMGVATQVGKTFWIGKAEELLKERQIRTVFFFHSGGEDFTPLFRDDWVASAYVKMESELRQQHFDLSYRALDKLDSNIDKWLRVKNVQPLIIISNWNENSSKTSFQHLGDLVEKFPDSRCLVDWSSGDFHLLPRIPRLHLFSRGNLHTARAKKICEFALLKGYSEIRLVIDEKKSSIESFLTLVRIKTEWLGLDKSLRFKLFVKPASGGKSDFFKRLNEVRTQQQVERILSKYQPSSQASLEAETYTFFGLQEIVKFQDKELKVPGTKSSGKSKSAPHLCVFEKDQEAIECRSFGSTAVLSLENHPKYFHHRITCCVPDWDQIGYLMAHSIVGDFNVAHSRRGFLKIKCNILDRGSC